ncbi:hypothetical protein BS78_01G386800 [Paspalum vaginatum]|nr:hypothetical protein BS78_01G386800 [Paspalum vaginatum]
MEDSVGEEERREQGETMAQAKAHRDEVAAAGGLGGGEPAEEGGFLSAMASKIGATMSGTDGSGGEVNATVASGGQEGERDGDGGPVEEGGFLSAMASKIGAAMSGANGGSDDGGGGNAAAVASDRVDKENEDGSGGGGIFHKLMSSSPPSSSPASGATEEEEVKGEGEGQDAAGEQAGILSSMASKIGMVMSAANGNGNHSTEPTEDDNHGGSGDNAKTSNDDSKGEENGGGILSAMATKIGMAVSGPNGNGNHSTEDDAKKGTGGGAVHGSKGEKEKGHDANGGRIVEHIISNLPSDDQAPDADEASLLIAIIED